MRTCVSCRTTTDASEMIRFVLAEDRGVVVDLAGRAFGRGAWVHPRPECLHKAASRGLAHSFRSPIATPASELFELVRGAAHRRVLALLAAAKASGKLKAGTEAVREQVDAGAARLILVSEDARAAAEALPARARGRALAWGDKASLGRALGRTETAVVAVLDARFAEPIARAVALSKIEAPFAKRTAGGDHPSVEV